MSSSEKLAVTEPSPHCVAFVNQLLSHNLAAAGEFLIAAGLGMRLGSFLG